MKKLMIFFIVGFLTCHFGFTQDKKPNIIFIFADDLGWGDLSCYGNKEIKTPYLDQLATEGTLFTHFYVSGSVCSPSRAAIMTGQYPARNRVFGHFARHEINQRRKMPDHLDPDLTTLTDLLKKEGYRTGHFGKWHLGDIAPSDYGVDEYRTHRFSNLPGKGSINIWESDGRPDITARILSEAYEFIERNQDQPVYVNTWLSDMHATLNPSEEQVKPLSRGFKADGVDYHGVQQVYYATLVAMDRQIGAFLDKLKESGLGNNTLIVFSSDNGPEDYQIRNSAHSGVGNSGPLRGRKRSIYEGGIRVPFIVKWPGEIPSGEINDHSIIAGVDFIPTLLKVAGGKVPSDLELDGEDISGILLGSDEQRNKPVMWEWRYRIFGHHTNHSPRLAVREGDWKLLMNPDDSRIELYNIPKDPYELQNLVKEYPEIVEKLKKQVMGFHESLPESPVDKEAGTLDYPWPGE